MIDTIIKLNYALSEIDLNKGHFRKRKKKKLIKEAKLEVFNEAVKASYTAPDIVNFVAMLESAKTIYGSDNIILPFEYAYTTGVYAERGKWPIIGFFHMPINYGKSKVDTYIRAHIDSDIDKQGLIEIKWTFYKENDENIIEKRYSKSMETIEANYNTDNVTEVDILENSTLSVLNNAFTIAIETIFDCIEEEYL